MKVPDFAEMIKLYRKKLNMTQEELASICGVARTSIVNYERGKSEPPAKIIWLIQSKQIKLCKHCNGKGWINS